MKFCPKCQRTFPLAQRFCLEDGTLLSLPDPYHLVGRTLAERYRIEALVGIGGMGAVYKAHHPGIDRQIAIKILQPNVALSNDRMIGLFEREARTSGLLTHENIASVYDAGRTPDGIAYIAMEWLEGRTLDEELAAHGPLSFSRVAELLRPIAAALSAAHAAHIIHRDLKPSNVMLVRRPDGSELVKVLDFGIAKIVTETIGSPVSALMGTPHYASPEQFRMGGLIDSRADIYSLGVMLFQMLTGALPFETTSLHELIQRQLHDPPPPLQQLRPDAPSALDRFISRMLAKEPEARPQRASEIPDLFERALRSRPEADFVALQTEPLDRIDAARLPTLIDRPLSISTEGSAPEPVQKSAQKLAQEPVLAAPPRAVSTIITRRTEVAAPSATAPVRRRTIILTGLLVIAVLTLAGTLYWLNRHDRAIDSVAVLPFTNESGDPGAEYLSDGISESLISSLSRLPNLKVIARSSVLRYKTNAPEPKTVGSELGVRAVLVGRVRQQGENLSVITELVDTSDSSRLWGEQYSRKLTDLLPLQEEITREIAAKLRLRLTSEERQRAVKQSTDKTEAYRLYLKGRYHWNKRTPDGLQQAISYFQQAIDQDPLYALAYSGLADSYFMLGPEGVSLLPAKEASDKQRAAAAKAISLDDTQAEAHTSLAVVKMLYDWDWGAAESEFKRAIELNPNYPTARSWYAAFLTSRGRFSEAIVTIKRAQELDPFSLGISNAVGSHYFIAGRYDEAIAQYRRTIEMNPKHPVPHSDLAEAYLQKRMYAEAEAEINQAIALSSRSARLITMLGLVSAASGKKEEAAKRLAELNEPDKRSEVEAGDLAQLYTVLGDKEKALAQLQKAFDERATTMLYLKVNPIFEPLHTDPRFSELLRRLGLE